jgi:hypothetical protein
MISASTTRLKQIAAMKLTEYFLKVCESCLPDVKENLKLVDRLGGSKLSLCEPWCA